MSPVDLSNSEWEEINKSLPDVNYVCDRISAGFPFPDWISLHEFPTDTLKQLRISNVCFRDAGAALRNARYALGQAIAVRKYFLDRSNESRDNNHLLADLRSRFYADYVPLLLWSAGEHTVVGIYNLFRDTPPQKDKLIPLEKKPYLPDKLRAVIHKFAGDSTRKNNMAI